MTPTILTLLVAIRVPLVSFSIELIPPDVVAIGMLVLIHRFGTNHNPLLLVIMIAAATVSILLVILHPHFFHIGGDRFGRAVEDPEE
jgi:ABC-type glycerol-3-phosphate transport system permease component